jgi:hypothetical protein
MNLKHPAIRIVPTISRFRGISILMYVNDHVPAHFHVEYGEYEAKFRLEDGVLFEGWIPSAQYRLVVKWMGLHLPELTENWNRIERGEIPYKIRPL